VTKSNKSDSYLGGPCFEHRRGNELP
jgi:hypothetical protein